MEWDRTHDWVLIRFWRDLTQITIQFAQANPSVPELAAIRRCLPRFREMTPADVKREIGHSGLLHLEAMQTSEAKQLIELLGKEQFSVIVKDVSFASYLPLDRTIGCARIIEDDEEARATTEAMLAAGVPVQHFQE